jgi:hypothetical protein
VVWAPPAGSFAEIITWESTVEAVFVADNSMIE